MKHARLLIAFLIFIFAISAFIGCSPITCENCNKLIIMNSSFCSNCGASINRDGTHVHDFSLEVPNDTYLNTKATCVFSATYYYSCECGEKGSDIFSYGEKLSHSFSQKVTTSQYLQTKATCSKPAYYYYSCKCGIHNNYVFTYGATLPHSFTEKDVSDMYLCSSATSTSAATYYYSCSSCGKRGTETFKYGDPLKDSWRYNYYVDYQFGEPTDEWYVTTCELLDGTFENSATDNASLLVEILYDCNDEISIFLHEYADTDNLVKNSSSQYKKYYKIVIKNENGKTYEARGQINAGGDRIYVIDTYHSSVLKMMKTSQNLRFYIEYEDSPTTQYRFDVDMTNFNDVVDSMK